MTREERLMFIQRVIDQGFTNHPAFLGDYPSSIAYGKDFLGLVTASCEIESKSRAAAIISLLVMVSSMIARRSKETHDNDRNISDETLDVLITQITPRDLEYLLNQAAVMIVSRNIAAHRRAQ